MPFGAENCASWDVKSAYAGSCAAVTIPVEMNARRARPVSPRAQHRTRDRSGTVVLTTACVNRCTRHPGCVACMLNYTVQTEVSTAGVQGLVTTTFDSKAWTAGYTSSRHAGTSKGHITNTVLNALLSSFGFPSTSWWLNAMPEDQKPRRLPITLHAWLCLCPCMQ